MRGEGREMDRNVALVDRSPDWSAFKRETDLDQAAPIWGHRRAEFWLGGAGGVFLSRYPDRGA